MSNDRREAQNQGGANGTRTLAIFGATGGVGLALARQALRSGHRVRVLVRSRARFEGLLRPALPEAAAGSEDAWRRLTVIEGAVEDEAAVRSMVAGADAVLCALGAPALSSSRVRSEGTAAIVRAMQAEHVDRIVAVSVFGALESRAQLPAFFRYLLFPLYLSRVVADHERQERLLAESGLRWTAVRPPSLVDRDAAAPVVHGTGAELGALTMTISRDALAAFMLDEVERGAYVGAAPAISYQRVSRRASAQPARGANLGEAAR